MLGIIREAIIQDIPAIYTLIRNAAKEHRILPRSKKEIKDVIDNFFIAEIDRKIIGCCALEIYSKKIAEIRSLVVKNNYKRRGIGKLLVNACLKRARSKKIYEVLSITDKISFFKKLGFDTCLNKQYAMFIHPRILS